jgi:hypothetical protein
VSNDYIDVLGTASAAEVADVLAAVMGARAEIGGSREPSSPPTLVNKRLCSAVRPVESARGRRFQAAQVPTMDRACLPHLAATVRILKPTLVILQSKGLRSLINPHLRHVERIDPANEQLECAEFAGIATVIASFSHPAAHAPYNWGSSHRNVYAVDVVEPTLASARRFILG